MGNHVHNRANTPGQPKSRKLEGETPMMVIVAGNATRGRGSIPGVTREYCMTVHVGNHSATRDAALLGRHPWAPAMQQPSLTEAPSTRGGAVSGLGGATLGRP